MAPHLVKGDLSHKVVWDHSGHDSNGKQFFRLFQDVGGFLSQDGNGHATGPVQAERDRKGQAEARDFAVRPNTDP